MEMRISEFDEIINRENELFMQEITKKLIDSILEIKVNKKFTNQLIRRDIVRVISEMIKDEIYLLNGYRALNNYESFYRVSLYIVDKKDLIKKFKILMNTAIANNIVFKSIHIKPILNDSKNKDNAIVLKKVI